MHPITLNEIHLFHTMDREIFERLVITLARDVTQSLLVIAIWLWMDEMGYPIISDMRIVWDHIVIGALADEAVLCLRALESREPVRVPHDGGLVLSSILVQKDISLKMIINNKFTAICGVKKYLNNVCARAFTDILQRVLPTTSNSAHQVLSVPGFPHPIYGSITIVLHPLDFQFVASWGWNAGREVPQDDRTMFLTFSRGFPVSSEEVVRVFTLLFGDGCVESVKMGEARDANDMQPLFALLVFRSVSTIDRILCGRSIAKFQKNEKQIWARKYDPRE